MIKYFTVIMIFLISFFQSIFYVFFFPSIAYVRGTEVLYWCVIDCLLHYCIKRSNVFHFVIRAVTMTNASLVVILPVHDDYSLDVLLFRSKRVRKCPIEKKNNNNINETIIMLLHASFAPQTVHRDSVTAQSIH